ncbi:NADH-quinone oxidoreductase subunit J family protein [Fibrella forsythiae]|uniref:NADH-quinone oxidoreductase subunit J n=1 Tax=Fibrella forsythiae TaxID=2817061 RepID=A0ABS3JGX3_9BACT|nr:NADH-quinone oxidoreductase subunit J [Fibrella forsythiae]MBO0949249.1 NADH-quinone oxidoreductase subunit J [Fibrella forsythiae]
MIQIAFFSFVALTLASAVGLLLTRNVLYAAYLLLLTLLGVAALFVFAGADFLAVSQLVVYVGGVLVLVLFGVMLTNKPASAIPDSTPVSERSNRILTENRRPWIAVLLAGGLFWGLSRLLINAHFVVFDRPVSTTSTTIDVIGKQLMTEYVLPFEIISILLLVALVGAGYLAKHKQ